jgi:hypothetical protein
LNAHVSTTNTLYAQLTEKQAAFVRATLGGADHIQSAALAGYSSPATDGWRLVRLPHIALAIETELRRRLQVEIAPACIAFLFDVVRNESKSFGERVRVDAAKTLLDRAGYQAPKQHEIGKEKAVEEMSTAELHAFIDRTEAELASRATDVSVPESTALDSQLSDLL